MHPSLNREAKRGNSRMIKTDDRQTSRKLTNWEGARNSRKILSLLNTLCRKKTARTTGLSISLKHSKFYFFAYSCLELWELRRKIIFKHYLCLDSITKERNVVKSSFFNQNACIFKKKKLIIHIFWAFDELSN